MSDFSTSISVIQQDTNGSSHISGTYTASEAAAILQSTISIGSVDEVLAVGDVQRPRYMFLKNLSTTIDLLIGFDGSTYPMRLKPLGTCLISLNNESSVETQTVQTIADSGGNLHDQYFDMADRNGGVRVVWSNGGSVTTVAAIGGRLITVPFTNNATAPNNAASLAAAFADDDEIAAAYNSGVDDDLVTLTDKYTGTRTDIADGVSTTGFTFATTQQGAALAVHVKSTSGTISAQFGVLPQ